MNNIPNFDKLLLHKNKYDYVAVDFETTYIDAHGNVDLVWMIGWMWRENDKRLYNCVTFPEGISLASLSSLLSNVHTRAQIHKRDTDQRLSQLLYLLKERPPAFHNAGFDTKILDAIGVELSCYHDTMMITYLVLPPATLVANVGDEDKLQLYALAELGRRGFCQPKLESPEFDKYSEEMIAYNRGDLESTSDLMDAFAPIIYADIDLLNAYVKVEMPAVELAKVMSRRGVHLPDCALDDSILDAEQRLEEINQMFSKYVQCIPSPNKPKEYVRKQKGDKVIDEFQVLTWQHEGKLLYERQKEGLYLYREVVPFNPGSTDHKRYVLKHLFGWESKRVSKKTGLTSCDKHALKTFFEERGANEFVKGLVDYNKYSTLLNNFLIKWKKGRDVDSRIHPSFIAVGTATGRYSSRNPNFQNIGPDIRHTITASEGNSIVYIDLSQAELRILAYYMMVVLNDSQLWSLYVQNKDVHSANMKLMNLNKNERVIAKRAIFLKIYGGGPGVLSLSCDVPIEKARYYLKKFDEVVPGIDLLAQAVRDAAYQSEIRSYIGRKIQYPAYKKNYMASGFAGKNKRERAFRQIFNSIFQGGNFDITTLLMWESLPYAYDLGGTPIIQVHDSGVYEVPTANAGILANKLYEIFNRDDILEGLPLKGMPGVGGTWAEAEADAKEREDAEKADKK